MARDGSQGPAGCLWPGSKQAPTLQKKRLCQFGASDQRPEKREIKDIRIAACFYNPQRYTRIRHNHDQWIDGMRRSGIDPYVIELAFDQDPYQLPKGPRNYQVRGSRSDHLLWQKERLLNILIDHIPDCDAIGWFDCDLLFMSPNWVEGIRETLSTHTICQPFADSYFVEADGSLTCLKRSMGWHAKHDQANYLNFGKSHPGFAWVARADWLRKNKLLDDCITGGGDSLMIKATTETQLFIERWLNADWKKSAEKWAEQCRVDGGVSIGYVPGAVAHLYHGKRSNRKYRERWSYLTDSDFNPGTDIETDPANGLIRWTETALREKPEMVSLVRGYFAERKEDEK
jgi:hypothetical protein